MVKEERAAMAIQQYDYTACCTGFLQQLPSFWGISTGNRRSFCRSTGRKGHKKGWARRTSGGPWRPLCPRRRAWRAQYVRARRSESVLKTSSERKRDVTGEKGPFLPLLLSTLNASLQKLERRAARKMPYYLVPSTVFYARSKTGSLFRFLWEKSARESLGWRSGSFLLALSSSSVWPSLSFGVKPSRFFAVLSSRRDFPRCRGSVSTQKGAFICSLCVRRSHRFEHAREGR